MTTSIMIFILVTLSVVNFSYVAFASRRVGLHGQRQQLLFDLQSARDKLLSQIKNNKPIDNSYVLGERREITVARKGTSAEIFVREGSLTESLVLKGITLEGKVGSQWFGN